MNLNLKAQGLPEDSAYIKVLERLKDTEVPNDYLDSIFSHPDIRIEKEVVARFNQPFEKKSYTEYRPIFINRSRIKDGIRFYNRQRKLITEIASHFGVDPLIMVSIVGVESNYGEDHKGYTVFNALYTIIHRMPSRANWAAKELAEFLKYCYRDRVNPHRISGSYAGAFGYGQFIPSSFNRYAVDFDGDGVREPFQWSDAMGSIANYLVEHGYDGSNPDFSKGSKNWKALWSYNHSDHYVRAILELREAIKKGIK